MKAQNMFQIAFIVIMACMSLIIPAQGYGVCLSVLLDNEDVDSRPPPPPKERTLKEVEHDIYKTRIQIREHQKEQARLQQEAMAEYTREEPPPAPVREESLGSDLGTYSSWNRRAAGRTKLHEARSHEQMAETCRQTLIRLEQERQTLISQTGGCFPPDTLVTMADGSVKPFQTIRPGDQVLTYDIGYQTMVGKPVLDVYTVEGNHPYTINGELTTTGTERLLSDTGWKRVRDLHQGDKVQIDGRMVEISAIDYRRTDNTLYNMQVDDSHNFYIVTDSGTRWLVHNSSSGGGSK